MQPLINPDWIAQVLQTLRVHLEELRLQIEGLLVKVFGSRKQGSVAWVVAETPAKLASLRAYFADRPDRLVNLRHARHDLAAQCALLLQVVVRYFGPRVRPQVQWRRARFPVRRQPDSVDARRHHRSTVGRICVEFSRQRSRALLMQIPG